MSDGTKIEWSDATWNIITGCSVVSAGCKHCYAMKLAGTRLRNHVSRKGLTIETKAGPVWNGEVRFNEQWLWQPCHWQKPRRIFVCAHGDLFHENVPDEWLVKIFAIMALAPQHDFQVLTKRPERAAAFLNQDGIGPVGYVEGMAKRLLRESGQTKYLKALEGKTLKWPLDNVWLGTSVEDQAAANERIPHLLDAKAAVRFLSCEPLLGPVKLTTLAYKDGRMDGMPATLFMDALTGFRATSPYSGTDGAKLDWVIVGGESGRDARPMHPNWARSLRDQCASAGVRFFFKQWGAWCPYRAELGTDVACAMDDLGTDTLVSFAHVGKKRAGRHLDGQLHDEFPRERA